MALDGGRADSQSEGDLLVSFAEETRASTFFSAAVSLGLRFVRVILFSSHALQFLSIAPFRRIFVKFFCFAAGEFRSVDKGRDQNLWLRLSSKRCARRYRGLEIQRSYRPARAKREE